MSGHLTDFVLVSILTYPCLHFFGLHLSSLIIAILVCFCWTSSSRCLGLRLDIFYFRDYSVLNTFQIYIFENEILNNQDRQIMTD